VEVCLFPFLKFLSTGKLVILSREKLLNGDYIFAPNFYHCVVEIRFDNAFQAKTSGVLDAALFCGKRLLKFIHSNVHSFILCAPRSPSISVLDISEGASKPLHLKFRFSALIENAKRNKENGKLSEIFTSDEILFYYKNINIFFEFYVMRNY